MRIEKHGNSNEIPESQLGIILLVMMSYILAIIAIPSRSFIAIGEGMSAGSVHFSIWHVLFTLPMFLSVACALVAISKKRGKKKILYIIFIPVLTMNLISLFIRPIMTITDIFYRF